ncbi:hypothetical protein PF005_g6284 [Phytophthora fragariae]|uniref:Uncharacterized protein n=2 Tax=Phytophthora fragariae TaxID=53985 RepID=A0A6A3LM60_9STRA|nr:hypothetical protein PF003_g2480 [Phytophthora fragariae]KAE9016893.1 hypothetical protein PF011_g6945 [Phytophthora fragariae]KAE9125212.1 hypothetical protein PF007_g6426 [Phytophthora fragariae]KAE9223477.1 hypothetical protein PF005_g6284 [Phytophthora fragariae]KAE9245400.1 hypothetical protein PF002_g7279 [Phytophthora fragariae]
MADTMSLPGHAAAPRKQRYALEIPEQDQQSQQQKLQQTQQRAAAKPESSGLQETLTWLEKQRQFVQAQDGNQRRKRSSTFVRSVLRLLSGPKDQSSSSSSSSNNAGDEEDKASKLPVPWGQDVLKADWSEVGFRLLDQPIMQDMTRVRSFIAKEELLSASPQGIIALAKWLQRFDNHVRHVVTLKEYLLEERTLIAGVGHKVTTLYDAYDEALAVALEKVHDERRDLSEAVLKMFDELEKILRGEVTAVKHLITQTLTEKEEYEVLSTLFNQLTSDEDCGVIVAHLLGWMRNNMSEDDVRVFLALFNPEVQDKIAGEWMRLYASYLHLLDEFSINYDSSLSYFT